MAWGYVGYKIYMALQGDDETELSYEKSNITKIAGNKKKDSVILNLRYSDPFLKNISSSNTNRSSESSYNTTSNKNNRDLSASLKTKTVQPSIDIKYLGLVKNNTSGTQTALISMNGKSFFVKKNDNIEGFVIKQISNESILIFRGKERLTINK